MMRYVILEKCPCPGYWEKTATCHIQQAELNSFPHNESYHHRALCWNNLRNRILLYTWDDAQTLLTYLREKRHYAEYRLLGVMTHE